MRRLSLALLPLALLPLASCRPGDAAEAVPRGSYVFVFAGMKGHHAMHGMAGDSANGADPEAVDFLAVIDADSASATYGQVVATAPLGTTGSAPHHVELAMPPGGRALFGNAYNAGRTYLFDLRDPRRPRVAGTADSVPGLRMPHSFARLPDGRVLATMQFGDGKLAGDPGGLALFTADGRVVRTGHAADATFPGAPIRTYALDVSTRADRVLTTSSAMDTERTADVVQLWRLSDLALLKTLAVPTVEGDTTSHYPFELRFLGDGRTALMNTAYCSFYILTGLDGPSPAMAHVLSLEWPKYTDCGVPLVVGHWWIMPVAGAHEYVVLDVSDPRHPRRASALATDTTFSPHWLSPEAGTDRLVATSQGPDPRVAILRFDTTSGRLSWDQRFRDRPDGPPGVSFDRATWPHGSHGVARPHGAVFSR